MTAEPTAVYRLYADDGSLLYVGISKHPEKRLNEHSQLKFWWRHVTRKEITWYPTRAEAEAVEEQAIVTERPRHDRTWRMSNSTARKHGITRVVEQDTERAGVADQLRQGIQSGEYQIGDKLPGYRGIADLFGVSITTAKFAVGRLERDGMVCNLSRSAGYPVTVVRRTPTGKPASAEEFAHLAGGRTKSVRRA